MGGLQAAAMRFAVYVPNFGPFHSPAVVAEIAKEAELAGWDGLFLWDHVLWRDEPVGDPWINLAAASMSTTRIRLGPVVTPIPRSRPWITARAAASLDLLSHGRSVLGVGIGSDTHGDFSRFGEQQDPRERGAMLDEGLALIEALWTGEDVRFAGHHYVVDGVVLLPSPVQKPRIPIWVAGTWPNQAIGRAGRWDGAIPQRTDRELSPGDVEDVLALMASRHPSSGPWDLLHIGVSADNGHRVRRDIHRLHRAGATWWLENAGAAWLGPDTTRRSLAIVQDRIALGPPR
jgi:alkanesulfonate monooxygenase SsuD/methylene tetrahydromethanopterin reductase-like flavin-dependent oxidoreductase (luciferase family)